MHKNVSNAHTIICKFCAVFPRKHEQTWSCRGSSGGERWIERCIDVCCSNKTKVWNEVQKSASKRCVSTFTYCSILAFIINSFFLSLLILLLTEPATATIRLLGIQLNRAARYKGADKIGHSSRRPPSVHALYCSTCATTAAAEHSVLLALLILSIHVSR